MNRTNTTYLTAQAKKNSASSVTDLRLLLKAEIALLDLLTEHEKISEIAMRILDAEGFAMASIHNSDVRHPVDGYNLIKRLGLVWPKVVEAVKLSETEGAVEREVMRQLERAVEQFPSWEENRVNFWIA